MLNFISGRNNRIYFIDQLTSRVEVRNFNGGAAGDYYDLQGNEPEPQELYDITLYDVCLGGGGSLFLSGCPTEMEN